MEGEDFKKFVEENRERLEKFNSINEAVNEEMEEINQNKAEHPELLESEYQLKIVNKFLEENKDVNAIELVDKNSKK